MKPFAMLALFVAFLPCTADAQVFYTYPGAPVTERNNLVFGPYIAGGDEELLRGAGFARFGISSNFDAGVEVLAQSLDERTMFGAGTDVKFRVFPATPALPFDLSLNGGIGFATGDDLSIVQVPLGSVLSAPFELDSGSVIVPYIAVYLLIIRTEIDRGRLPDLTDTDVDVEMRSGIRFPVGPALDLFGAIHVGVDAVVTLGLVRRM